MKDHAMPATQCSPEQEAIRQKRRTDPFRARMQPFFSLHDAHKGWLRIAAGGIEVRNIPGNHLGMLQEPHVQVLAKELSPCLEKANREG